MSVVPNQFVFVPLGNLWRLGKVISVNNFSFEVSLSIPQQKNTCSWRVIENDFSFCDDYSQNSNVCTFDLDRISKDVFLYEDIADAPELIEDLCEMNYLHSPAVLLCIQRRYWQKKFFTCVHNVVISMNPYEDTPDIQASINLTKKDDHINKKAHINLISKRSFENFTADQTSQSIVVTGESGAGKTETVKMLINQLSIISNSQLSNVVQQIISANRALELFGNAQTERNNNSSRYGKLIKLQFSNTNQEICCCTVQTYLLEKFRVISCTSPNETNFHIFYQIFELEDELKEEIKLTGKNPSDFRYTKNEQHTDTPSPGHEFIRDVQVGLHFQTEREVLDLFKVISGLLYLGEWDPDCIESEHNLSSAALLLGVEMGLLSEYLGNREIHVDRETISTELNTQQKCLKRDATVTQIYYELFQWAVSRINRHPSDKNPVPDDPAISLLDIFGFEILKRNSLEQLLINFANEKLHRQFLTNTIFSIQEEYNAEGIPFLTFDLGQKEGVIEQLANKFGLFDLMHEQCIVPGGSDIKFANSLRTREKSLKSLALSKCSRKFTIMHFAGKVQYQIDGLIERNKDAQVQGLCKIMMQSKNPMLMNVVTQSNSNQMSDENSFICPSTIAKAFTSQLNNLVDSIQSTDLHYIKCIKPNNQKLPDCFDEELVLEQLKYTGVIEAAKVIRCDFQYKISLKEFYNKYRCLTMQHSSDFSRFPSTLLETYPLSPSTTCLERARSDTFKVGHTKLFASSEWIAMLDKIKYNLQNDNAIKLQGLVRVMLARKAYSDVRQSATVIQKAVRLRSKQNRLKRAIHCIQKSMGLYLVKKRARIAKENHIRQMRIEALSHSMKLQSLKLGFKAFQKAIPNHNGNPNYIIERNCTISLPSGNRALGRCNKKPEISDSHNYAIQLLSYMLLLLFMSSWTAIGELL